MRLDQVVQISIQENIDAGHCECMNGVGFYDDSPETSEAILFNGSKHASPLVVVNVVGVNRIRVNSLDRNDLVSRLGKCGHSDKEPGSAFLKQMKSALCNRETAVRQRQLMVTGIWLMAFI